DQVLGLRHQHVGGIGAGAVDAEEARSRDAIVVPPSLAHRAFAAADPRIDQALVADLYPFCARPERFDDAERLMAEGERRHAAALFDVEALAAAEIEVAIPDVHVGMAHARARDAHEHFAALRPR